MMSASTSTKDPLVPPSSTSSSNSPSWIYNKTLRYCWMLVGCVVAVLMETLIWRRFISKTCGSYCSLKYKLLFVFVLYVFTISHPFSSNKEDIYFKYANELVSFDYSKMGNLQYKRLLLVENLIRDCCFVDIQLVSCTFTGSLNGF